MEAKEKNTGAGYQLSFGISDGMSKSFDCLDQYLAWD